MFVFEPVLSESPTSEACFSDVTISGIPSQFHPYATHAQTEPLHRYSPDTTHSNITSSDQIVHSSSQITSSSQMGVLHNPKIETTSTVGRNSKKHVGMRYLFPALPDSMSLLEKTKIWVERHTHGYYVGWTWEQMKDVDKLVRPLCLVTEKMYKQHMNR